MDLHSIYGELDWDGDDIRSRRPDPQHPVRVVLGDVLRNNDIDWDEYEGGDPVAEMTHSSISSEWRRGRGAGPTGR